MRHTVLETERLFMRGFMRSDWQDLYEYLSLEEVVRYEPYTALCERDCKREAVRRSETDSFRAVCLKETQKMIGNLYLAQLDFGAWELGYVFNPVYHGKGYATEAAFKLVDDVFANRGARRVVAKCDPLNEPSWRLLERLGMRREAFFRQNVFFRKNKAGQPIWKDTFEYGILAHEWPGYPHGREGGL